MGGNCYSVNLDEAIDLVRRILSVREKNLSHEHEDVIDALYLLASLYEQTSNLKKAAVAYEDILHRLRRLSSQELARISAAGVNENQYLSYRRLAYVS